MATEKRFTEETARATMTEVARRADVLLVTFERWWVKQTRRTQIGTAVAALVGVILLANLCGAVSRPTASTLSQAVATTAPAVSTGLAVEFAPSDAGKAWTLNRAWQGSGRFQTTAFTVGEHWRVDWLFTPTQPGAALQVFVYTLGGTPLQIAANTHNAGADTSFWTGAGTYVLQVNAVGGDWKLDVQELH